MYKVSAERFDPSDLVHRQENYWNATSFECIAANGYVKLWLEDGTIKKVPVSSREHEYQCVIVYAPGGEVVQYMKAVKGVVSVHLGPVLDR
jgi:hypothetical protein